MIERHDDGRGEARRGLGILKTGLLRNPGGGNLILVFFLVVTSWLNRGKSGFVCRDTTTFPSSLHLALPSGRPAMLWPGKEREWKALHVC